jgi:transcriptional regulator with XRE-family HTH domain/tetratricopeptide (TPR) repeat protein
MEPPHGPREPNRRLAELIAEAGCSNAGLARRVNLTGAELGLDLRYDKTSVARWLRGQQPRATTPALVAEALGRKLGRPVTVEEIGMVDARDGTSSLALGLAADPEGAVAVAAGLWRADAAGREQLRAASFAVTAMVGPSRDWLIMAGDPVVARGPAAAGGKNGHAPLRVGFSDVAAVRAATEAFRTLDHRFGGGHVRVLAVRYLDGVVAELLRGIYPEKVGRQLFSAAAALTELAGYLACDTGRLGLAQRYYIQALRLSQAADDRAHGGHILSAMSYLANSLGAPRETVQLARSADEGSRGTASPHVRAEFYCAEARGHAAMRDRRAAEQALGRASDELEHGNGDAPAWSSYFDHHYIADAAAVCYRDLDQPRQAAEQAAAALAGFGADKTRRRVLSLFTLASARVQGGEVEAGCAAATEAVKLSGRARSARAIEALHDFERRLDPYNAVAATREFRGLVASRRPGEPINA